jgi:hypothetical protein
LIKTDELQVAKADRTDLGADECCPVATAHHRVPFSPSITRRTDGRLTELPPATSCAVVGRDSGDIGNTIADPEKLESRGCLPSPGSPSHAQGGSNSVQ